MKYKYDLSKNPMWISKEIGIPIVDWCLCVSEDAYQVALKQLEKQGKRIPYKWIDSGAECQFVFVEGKLTDCIVCMVEKDDPIDNAAFLVHEAVHIWQYFCGSINEENPSVEFEAYTIQYIATRLFHAYRQVLLQRATK
jgi:hypothetical protein